MAIKSCLLFQITIFLILLNCLLTFGRETPEPAAYLRPRHFNPHPYKDGRRNYIPTTPKYDNFNNNNQINNIYNPGPVQFPPNANDQNNLRKLKHPYRELSLKGRQQQQQLGRYSTYDNHLVTPETLTNQHEKQIIKNPRSNYRQQDVDSSATKKHYAFSYSVKDHASGDDFSHSQQQQKDGAVRGSYKVQLPDGRTQVVRYTADDNGYHADVSYNVNGQEIEDGKSPIVVETPTHPQVVEPELSPALLSAQPIYDYYKSLHLQGKPYIHSQDYAQYDDQAYHQEYNSVASSTPTYDVSPKPQSLYHQVNVADVNINGHTHSIPQDAIPHSHVILSNQHPTTASHTHHHHQHTHSHKPGLIAKVISSTVSPPFQDITVIPATKLISHPTIGYDYYSSSHHVQNQNNLQYADYGNYISSTVQPNTPQFQHQQALYYKTVNK